MRADEITVDGFYWYLDGMDWVVGFASNGFINMLFHSDKLRNNAAQVVGPLHPPDDASTR